MVADGKIFAKIDTTSSMVSFFENPQTYTGNDSIAIMSEKMKECKELAERVANVKAKVMTSNKYIENAVIEDRPAAMNTNPDSAKANIENGNGPIHVALKHEASLEVIQKLLECAPLITLESENKLLLTTFKK